MAMFERGSAGYELERVMRTIFKRCLDCPSDAQPACPDCPSDQICSLIPTDCNTCAHAVCVAKPNSPPSTAPGPNVGAIAGGVVGGVALIALLVFLLWFLWIRRKRAQQEKEAEEWEQDEIAQQKAAFQSMLHDAASTRTRQSFANSVLSRASNVIQIAFIPGVTTRSGSSHNSMLDASPVPPIPAARGTPRSPLSNQDDAIFFRPGDIRDSSYSGNSSMLFDRRDTQYSLDSRASTIGASSVYHESLTMQPVPSATARGMARMVSVKSATSPSGTPNEGTTSTPTSASEYSQFSANTPAGKGTPSQVMMPGQGSRAQGGTVLQTSGSFGKAQQITLGNAASGAKAKGRFPVRTNFDAADNNVKHSPLVSSPLRDANTDTDDDEEEEHARARRSLLKTSPQPTQQPFESPFADSPTQPSAPTSPRLNPYATLSSTVGTSNTPRRGKSMGGLSAVIEEFASKPPSNEGPGVKREPSPFDDEHKIE